MIVWGLWLGKNGSIDNDTFLEFVEVNLIVKLKTSGKPPSPPVRIKLGANRITWENTLSIDVNVLVNCPGCSNFPLGQTGIRDFSFAG